MPILTGPLRGRRWVSDSATHGCWLGTYERELQEMFVAHVKPGDVVFDVGANVGFFTLLSSLLVGVRGRVVAFEPLPRNLALLRRHLEVNAVGNATVVAAAVADEPGSGFLGEAASPSQGSLSTGSSAGCVVRVVALDPLVADGMLPAPSVMKIDVEGAESRVLSGARSILSIHRPVLFLSGHGYRQQALCADVLAGHGYDLVTWRDGRSDGQYETLARPGAGAARSDD